MIKRQLLLVLVCLVAACQMTPQESNPKKEDRPAPMPLVGGDNNAQGASNENTPNPPSEEPCCSTEINENKERDVIAILDDIEKMLSSDDQKKERNPEVSPPPQEPPRKEVSQADLNLMIRRSGIDNVSAEVSDSEVVVKGSVRNMEEKERVLGIATEAKGMRRLKDQVFVVQEVEDRV